MSTATATAPTTDAFAMTKAFWDFVYQKVDNRRKWENLSEELAKVDPQKEGIPPRRIKFLKSEQFGIVTMSAEELAMFARLLQTTPLELIKTFNCGYKRMTRADLDAFVKDEGLVWDVVDHIA